MTAVTWSATPSQRRDAACIAAALVLSDLIDDTQWKEPTTNRLGDLLRPVRPSGSLAERCVCNLQLGQRLLRAAKRPTGMTMPYMPPDCGHTVPALPTTPSLEIAMGLVGDLAQRRLGQLVTAARALDR